MFSVAIAFGDPHMITLDGVEYTFNGYGEYHIIRVAGPEFNLQGRMQPLVDQSGNTTKATVYKAFATKQNNSDIVQVRPFIPKPGINLDSESKCPCISSPTVFQKVGPTISKCFSSTHACACSDIVNDICYFQM